MQTGIPHSCEEYAVMNDGTSVYLSNKTPIRDKNNVVIGLLGISIDITERKKMEVALRYAKEQAETASTIKSEFIASMSQDLLIPLSGITELSKRLEQHLADNTEEKQQANGIYESSKQLLKLLTASFELVSNDKIQETDNTYLQPFGLRQSIQEISALLYPKLKLKHIDLKMEVSLDVPEHFISDDTKLRRILLTLLVYIIKRIESSTLTIKVELIATDCAYAQLRFSIIDTTSSMLFDSAELMSQDVSLQIAQKYVGILGGEIQCRSELKHGSIFDFILSLKIA
jgi:signal transduction histidine kinase